jgi:hypothetical protein
VSALLRPLAGSVIQSVDDRDGPWARGKIAMYHGEGPKICESGKIVSKEEEEVEVRTSWMFCTKPRS